METKTEKVKKSRSGGFPVINLEEAIAILGKGADAGWEMSKETFATAIGGSTANSGAFLLKLASLRDYGLIERSPDIKYSQLAKEIIAPQSDDLVEKNKKLQIAFANCPVFNGLYERIKNGSGESSLTTISNIGVNDFKISFARRELFANNFVLSGKFAGLLEETADGKIRIIKNEETAKEKNGTNDNTVPDNLTLPQEDILQNVDSKNVFSLSDAGIGWSVLVKSKYPLNSEVRKKLIEIYELLEKDNSIKND